MQGLIQTGSLNVNGFIWKFNGPIDDFAWFQLNLNYLVLSNI
jgi:hypothetical protein